MISLSFRLNDQPISELKNGAVSFPAFSGLGAHTNKRASVCLADVGPIPFNTYYIVDRKSGGRFGKLMDMFGHKDEWFALYAADNKVDDETFCGAVKRGQFRLHPKGTSGISKGCITLPNASDFVRLRSMLLAASMPLPNGSGDKCYGTVLVS